jgi:magnesium-transporting ATPase (P-type)
VIDGGGRVLMPGMTDAHWRMVFAPNTLANMQATDTGLMFTVFAARSDCQSAFVGMFSNKWLWAAVLLSLVLQAAVINVSFLQQAFSTTALSTSDWLKCAAVGSSVLWLTEFVKLLARASRKRAAD